MNPPLDSIASTFCGRSFSGSELALVQQIVKDYAGLSVHEISLTLCELLDWKRPSGKLKGHECRQWLELLQQQGVVSLPALRVAGPRGPRQVACGALSDPQAEIVGSAGEFEPYRLEVVERGPDSRQWTEYVERYHYLGYRVPVGANLRYLVRSERCPGQVLACLLWSSPAWKMAPRDRWIGWSPEQRARNLQFVVNHSRFLILPWVRVKGLASKILAACARQLSADWEQRYGYRPLLLETLVDRERFRGTCYRAANWQWLGQTQGRGRMDAQHAAHGQAVKWIYVYPLCREVQRKLRGEADVFSAGQNRPLRLP